MHDGGADGLHQVMECAEENADVEGNFAVDQSELQALVDIGFVIFALNHRDQVFTLEAFCLDHHIGAFE
jgi:hypothetical protein